ncbi:hypothetical protein GQ53DRAFT_778146 [Thozetella sp. PMI_491]|nr:hypothetical protein GQ53DRAFT_778146 [Thozetella sp. PMI_491]
MSRRQAVNACSACRDRKIRCDEGRPSCGRCVRLGLSCTYVETINSKKALHVQELADTLRRMESKIDALMDSRGREGSTAALDSADMTNSQNCRPSLPLGRSLGWDSSFQPMQELAIPKRHLTAPQHLLAWPCSPIRLTDWERRYPLQLEVRRPKQEPNISVAMAEEWLAGLSVDRIRLFAALYFAHLHPQHLILDEDSFYGLHLQRAIEHGFKDGIDSCLVLLVLCLGVMACRHADSSQWSHGERALETPACGLGLLSLAVGIFRRDHETDWHSVQCLLLMGQEKLEPNHCQLYWIAYLQESQILAELDFPPSGVSGSENVVPLPLAPTSDTNPHQQDYQSFFLALISMRRLLNRIHSYIYNQGKYPYSLSSPPPAVVAELDRQIEQWKACLPEVHQFPNLSLAQELESTRLNYRRSLPDRLIGHLKTRYYSAKAILYRSCVYAALNPEMKDHMSASDIRGAQIALSSALLSVLAGGILHEPCEYLLHPINAWRTHSLFAAEIQVAFTIRNAQLASSMLPPGWEMIQYARKKAVTQAAPDMSPTLARDYELLKSIVAAGPKPGIW